MKPEDQAELNIVLRSRERNTVTTASARVQLTVEIEAKSSWSNDTTVAQIDQQALGHVGVGLALLQGCAQQALQLVAELLGFEHAHTGQRQGTGLAQALHHLLHVCGQCVGIQLGRHMLQFVVNQLVQIQPTQTKEFFVVQLAALVVQMHLQAFAKKRAHGFAQEARQLQQGDGGYAVGGFQYRQQACISCGSGPLVANVSRGH